MARLSIEKQEKFANYLANGYTQIAAYKEAGYACKNSTAAANASKLASEPTVAARIEELKLKATERALTSTAPPLPLRKVPENDVDLEWINNQYIDFLNIAKDEKDLKNAAILLKDLAEINKIRPEKSEGNNNDKLSNMGSPFAIQIINQESSNARGNSDGFFEIEIPNPEPHYADHITINEDDES